MTTANDILGTSGKEAIPFEYQVEEQQLARQRAVSQLMLTQGLKQAMEPPQQFGKHVTRQGIGSHLVNALGIFMGQRGLTQADEASTGMAGRMAKEQSADMMGVQNRAQGMPGVQSEQAGPPVEGQTSLPPMTTGAVAPDMKGAIAQALGSKFSRVNAMGMDMQKNNREQIAEQMKLLGTVDPIGAIRRAQSGDPMSKVPDLATPGPIFGTDPAGNAFAQTGDLKGTKPTVTYAPKPVSITNNTDVKTVASINDESAKHFNYGGKGYEAATTASNNLNVNAEVLQTLAQSPVGGAGADLFQTARKWAETAGFPVNDKTTPTEMASMQLGQRVYAKLGTLGSQVSDADRKFMIDMQGSITTDPEALRKLIMIENKYLMKAIDKHNVQREKVLGNLPAGADLPYIDYRYSPANERDDKDFQLLYQNKPFSPRPVAGTGTAPGAMPSRFKAR